jgi:RNA polymerase sigma-70 factor (ECF subfamily)
MKTGPVDDKSSWSMDTATLADAGEMATSETDPRWFASVFDRHARTVYRFASRRVGTEGAKDVTAETFRVAFERRASFDPGRGEVLPWLFGIAANVLRGYRRAERRQLRAASAHEVEDAEFQGIEDRLDAQAAVPVLARALLALSPDDRDTLLLFAWTDLGYEGIANALGVPVGTVGSRLNRARRIVREELYRAGWRPFAEEGEER